MQQIETKKIKVGRNPRKDFGDLTELAASIKERGILDPLQLNEKNELIESLKALIDGKGQKVAAQVMEEYGGSVKFIEIPDENYPKLWAEIKNALG